MPVRFVYGVLYGAQAIEFIFNITQSAMVKESRDLEELLDVRSFPVLSLSRCSPEVRTFGCAKDGPYIYTLELSTTNVLAHKFIRAFNFFVPVFTLYFTAVIHIRYTPLLCVGDEPPRLHAYYSASSKGQFRSLSSY